ncbi:heavy-metal-associated domain-containing protein [Aliiroseovarius sp.]|uniref:heavy-metal-associated domain-containing protein n=1 Tax=Aliiroseovarius sp. TaxID=1872442 RepID=UPI003BAAA1A5
MTTWTVPSMHCGKCSAKIEAAVTEADPTAFLEFDMEARSVEVDSVLDAEALKAAFDKAGFEATQPG